MYVVLSHFFSFTHTVQFFLYLTRILQQLPKLCALITYNTATCPIVVVQNPSISLVTTAYSYICGLGSFCNSAFSLYKLYYTTIDMPMYINILYIHTENYICIILVTLEIYTITVCVLSVTINY